MERVAHARRDHRGKRIRGLLAREIVKLTVKISGKPEKAELYTDRNFYRYRDYLITHKIDIDKRKIQLEEPIKTVGEYEGAIRFAPRCDCSH